MKNKKRKDFYNVEFTGKGLLDILGIDLPAWNDHWKYSDTFEASRYDGKIEIEYNGVEVYAENIEEEE